MMTDQVDTEVAKVKRCDRHIKGTNQVDKDVTCVMRCDIRI